MLVCSLVGHAGAPTMAVQEDLIRGVLGVFTIPISGGEIFPVDGCADDPGSGGGSSDGESCGPFGEGAVGAVEPFIAFQNPLPVRVRARMGSPDREMPARAEDEIVRVRYEMMKQREASSRLCRGPRGGHPKRGHNDISSPYRVVKSRRSSCNEVWSTTLAAVNKDTQGRRPAEQNVDWKDSEEQMFWAWLAEKDESENEYKGSLDAGSAIKG